MGIERAWLPFNFNRQQQEKNDMCDYGRRVASTGDDVRAAPVAHPALHQSQPQPIDDVNFHLESCCLKKWKNNQNR